ncbi:hypothetical protein BDW02DRAFT_575563 [Decorospora gaudefroyi]|uniref:C2H2-type domain-containing protein n=1 Tax=Decorospora gaudefroyi TaxID=184978 RepID=A0A6A5KLV4_9PLEO|nr:hypothetical protein BDW02DRAFT_575563 [Decorospora gaudefroyi]
MSDATSFYQPWLVLDRAPSSIREQERSFAAPALGVSTFRQGTATPNDSSQTSHCAEAPSQASTQHSGPLATTLFNEDSRPKKYRCEECSESYDHPKNLREHKQAKHRGIRYVCDFPGCKKSMAQKKNLARHKAAKHGLRRSDEVTAR